MRILPFPARETWDELCKRPKLDYSSLDSTISSIIHKVREEGDKALLELTARFDGFLPENLKVTASEIKSAEEQVSDDLKNAINLAAQNIYKFHEAQVKPEKLVETTPGINCWRKAVAIEKAGLYIPGGTAPLFSTVLMLAIPAKIAGCGEIIICTPPDRYGVVNPLILYAASYTGITDIYRVGGAQAIAAMAYGTETIPRVDKIFGPGNQYVTRAKEMVQLDGVSIDMPAGPSEVLVIADGRSNPAFVSADLLSQAEHGADSQVILLSDDTDLLSETIEEIKRQANLLVRKDIAFKSLENSRFILLASLDECMEFSNLYAPEHLVISVDNPSLLADKVINAGSVFLGKYSCESAGDYASGTNHTLPTGGYARSLSGVSVDSFVKKITFQELTREGIKNIGPAIEKMAEAEQLQGHKNAVSIRLKSLDNE